MVEAIKKYASLVKFSHTVFALPFAFIGFFAAARILHFNIEWYKLALMLGCMVFARNAAMGFNRWADRNIDAANSRTKQREIPQGIIKPKYALIFVIINVLLFIITTVFINTLCFALSPIALLIILGYSYTKRFTSLSHFVLGLGLAIAPTGAFLVLTGSFYSFPIWISALVLLWAAGFDIIYALQDEAFDKQKKLKSIPAKLGIKQALNLSILIHIPVAAIIVLIGIKYNLHPIYWIGAIIFISLLLYQHIIVKPKDLSKINIAFGITNGIASILYGSFTIIALLIK
jgi:4-hydroxybenzoate polyprenyltransferase